MSRRPFLLPGLILFASNLALVGPLLVTERTDFPASIEGAFIGLARFLSEHPSPLGWYPYWYCGTPIQFTYTPGLHYLNALAIRLLPGIEPGQVYHAVAAILYALASVSTACLTFYFTRSRRWAFLAGGLHSLWSPAMWLIGEIRRDSVSLEAPWRLQVLVKYGEGPHTGSLLLLPLAVCALWKTVNDRRFPPLFASAALLAATVLVNWVGAFALGAVCFCFLLTVFRMPGAWRVAAAAALAWLLAAFWITPAFVRTIARNAQTVSGHYEYQPGMLLLAAGALGGLLLIRWLFPAVPGNPYLCFLSLGAFFFCYLGLSSYWFGLYMIPQPHRYIPEMELFLILLVCEALRLLNRRAIAAAAAGVLLAAGVWQQRRYLTASYRLLRPARVTEWSEYKMARWLAENVTPGSRVYIIGSEGMSLNQWANVAQVKGWFDPGIRSQLILDLSYQISSGENAPPDREGPIAVDLLYAVGAAYVVVHGPDSKVAYHDFPRPAKFEALLPAVFRLDPGQAVYEVPGARLAHVVYPGELARRTPVNGLDLEPIRLYINAIRETSRPALETRWDGPNELEIQGEFPENMLISLRISEDDGWRAYQGLARVPIERDPLGFMVLRPAPDPEGRLRLRYVGSREQRFFAWISLVSLGACLIATLQSKRRSVS